jgi:aldose sugar dehydrogenase
MSERSRLIGCALALVACGPGAALAQSTPFAVTELADFDMPWALEFLPDGRLLVSEQRGALKLYGAGGAIGEVSGVPQVAFGGQGGFGDVVLHPKYAENRLI